VTDDQLRTERLLLLSVTPPLARAVLDGHLDEDPDRLPDGLRAAPGWPTADTVNGLRLSFGDVDAQQEPQASGGSRVIVRADTGEVIGDLGWKGGPDESGVAEIGYGLAGPSRRQGYGTEAVAAFADWALGPGGASSLIAEVLADNVASRRLLERVGFTVDHVVNTAVWYRRIGALPAQLPGAPPAQLPGAPPA